MCMNVLLARMSVYHVGAWCLWRPDESAGSSETGLTDDCEPPCRCWELNPSPLQKSESF
jgi:E3 ubiquitin-protein ligase NEDD4